MPINYATIYDSLYTRVTTDSDGSAVRALVGGTTSIFPRKDLGNLSGRVLPYLVWSPQAVGGSSGQMRDFLASWWAYVSPNLGDKRLYEIVSALETLYGSPGVFDISGGRLSVVFVGRPALDAGLSLYGLEVRIGYRRLG